jgi:hypothetical protein
MELVIDIAHQSVLYHFSITTILKNKNRLVETVKESTSLKETQLTTTTKNSEEFIQD